MIYGDERRIVLIKDIKSPYFDEAYFVMKGECESLTKSDVLIEAEKILGKAHTVKRKKGNVGKILYFFACGLFLGATLAFLTTIFI